MPFTSKRKKQVIKQCKRVRRRKEGNSNVFLRNDDLQDANQFMAINPNGSLKKCCVNCKRCNMDMNGNIIYNVHIQRRNGITGISRSALVDFEELQCEEDSYVLCDECTSLIQFKILNPKKRVPWNIGWPSFLWHSFILPENEERILNIWRLLPIDWRTSWLEKIQFIHSSFENLEINSGGITFDNGTFELEKFKEDLSSWKRVRVEDCLNKHCVPTVRCPWGCTEYIENCGFLSFGIFLFSLKPIIFIVTENYLSFPSGLGVVSRQNCFNGMRPDYLDFEDCRLKNPEWKIKPKIVDVKNKGPSICTCSLHKNGSRTKYIHPPINPFTVNEISSQTNNLAPAVLVPRTFKNMKINNYNDSYEMVKLSGGYTGMDCCSITLNRRFENGDYLSLEDEILSVHGRKDIKEKLSLLVRSKEVSQNRKQVILNEIRKRKLDGDERLKGRNIGSNYIKLNTSIALTEAIKEEDEQQANGCLFPWPGRLITVMDNNNYYEKGPYYTKGFLRRGDKDSRLTWLLLSLATRIENVWHALHEQCFLTHCDGNMKEFWTGWILKYSIQDILDDIYQPSKKCLYKKRINLDQLEWILHNPGDFIIPTKTIAKQYDPIFSWRDLNNVFEEIPFTEVLEADNVLSQDTETILSHDTSVLMIQCTEENSLSANRESTRDIGVPLNMKVFLEKENILESGSIEYEESNFELSYISQQKTVRGKLNVIGCSNFKHEEEGFVEYWTSSMMDKNVKVKNPIALSNFGEECISIENCCLLVYTKKQNKMEEINRNYLDSLGNKASCKCPVHDHYLVNIPKINRRFCKMMENGKKCKREATFMCIGYDQCRTVCCEIHKNMECGQHCKDTIYKQITGEGTRIKYCKSLQNGEFCGNEATFKCNGFEFCEHVCCENHIGDKCPHHEEYTSYSKIPRQGLCTCIENGVMCTGLAKYKCPTLNCSFSVCDEHRNKKWPISNSGIHHGIKSDVTIHDDDSDGLPGLVDRGVLPREISGGAELEGMVEDLEDEDDEESLPKSKRYNLRRFKKSKKSQQKMDMDMEICSDHDFDDLPDLQNWCDIENESDDEEEICCENKTDDENNFVSESGNIQDDIILDMDHVMETNEHLFHVEEDDDDRINDNDSYFEAVNLVENPGNIIGDLDMMLLENQLQSSPWNQLPQDLGLECINNYVSSTNNEEPLNIDVSSRRVETMVNKNNYLNLHALFNKHMSLLIRSKSILQPTKKEQSFLQRIVSTAGHQSVPLLYPEGMLFPSLFWKGHEDGSIEGAIPSGFWRDKGFCGKYGYAGIEDHMRTRLLNSSLHMSCNPDYIFFAFDAINNVTSRGIDSRFIFKRGFEHMLGDSSIHRMANDHSLGSKVIDSRKTVAELSSMIREEEPTYFYTHTCNQKSHFRVAPIRRWIDARCDEITYDERLSPSL